MIEHMFDTVTRDEPPFETPDEIELIAQITERELEAWLTADSAPAIPWAVDSATPGVALAAALSSVDVSLVRGDDRVTVMKACQRMVSHFQARLYESMAAVADAVIESLGEDALADPALAEQAGASEIRAALRLTRKAADTELAVARDFQRRLPEVWKALADGRLDRRRANLIVHQTGHLSTAAAQEVTRRVLRRAPELTTGQLTALLKKMSVEADPEDAKIRYEAAIENRRVVVEPTVDGTANLHLYDIAPDTAMDIARRINAAARQVKSGDETRTMDQLRADVATDMLFGQAPGLDGRTGRVTITTSLASLAGMADEPGELHGFGPVIADIARQVTEQSHGNTWNFTVTDDEGRPVHTGTTRRRPTASDQRRIEAEYPTCVFPGCRMAASDCDLDHREPWAEGGATEPDNLAPLCRRDHRLRHEAGWQYGRADNGDHEWVSPLGQSYTRTARAP